MRYTDHSRVVTDHVCPRARYWGYEHGGRGVGPVEPDIALSFGAAIAEAAEAIRKGEPTPAYGGALPWGALYRGLTDAFRTRVWPVWQRQYRLVATEVECLLELGPGLTYQARPDAVVERLSDHTFWYVQDKTTSLSPENFARGWDKLGELHATAVVYEKQTGTPMSGVLVQGWYKGYQKNDTLYSPLAYCWLKPGQPGVSKGQPSFEYRPGWPRVPITDLDVAAWVKSLPEPLVQQQFPVTSPIMLRRDLAETYLAQVRARELSLEGKPKEFFPQHFEQCEEWSKYRRKCSWYDCCWAPNVARGPVESQMFVWREPHHAAEKTAMDADRSA